MIDNYNIIDLFKNGDDNKKEVINEKIYEIIKYMGMKNIDIDMVNNDI